MGRLTHLTGVLIEKETGIKLLSVPYKGGPAQAFADVTSGRVGLVVDGYSSLAGAASAGSIKLLAVALDKRLADFPDVPTVAATIPGFRATGWAVLLAPPGTPEAIVRKISEDLIKVSAEPELAGAPCEARCPDQSDDARTNGGFHRPAAEDMGAGAGDHPRGGCVKTVIRRTVRARSKSGD